MPESTSQQKSDDQRFKVDHAAYEESSRKRYVFACTTSIVWVVFWSVCALIVADKPLNRLHLNEIGDFLAGVFAPVAFFWLVVGYLQQGDELKLTRDEIRSQGDELRKSVKQQKKLAKMAKQTHSADMDDRQRRNSIEKKKAQPRFAIGSNPVRGAIGKAHIDPEKSTLTIAILNVGESCWSFYVESRVVADGVKMNWPTVDDFVPLYSMHYDENIQFSIPMAYTSTKSRIRFRLHYSDQLLEKSWQEFEIVYHYSDLISVEELAKSF